MPTPTLFRAVSAAAFILAIGSPAFAQSSSPFKIEGTISDYSDGANAAGPWHISGEWSAELRGFSGRVDFVASIAMVRAASGAGSHTHHIALFNATVTPLTNGYRLSGDAIITGSGSLAGFSGTPLSVEITGGTALPLSNVKLIFSPAAQVHFGPDPIEGVVTLRR